MGAHFAAVAAARHGPGDDVAIQRLAMGTTSCFEEYLQIHIDAVPIVNDSVRELLEVLFPRLTPDG